MYDIIIIGGGVTGAACAMELSRYNYKILLLEATEDVCSGTSKANSGIVHAGFDAEPGTLMAKLNVEGSLLIPKLSAEIGFAYRQNGSLVVCTNTADIPQLQALKEKGEKNGVQGLRIVYRDELEKMEPNIADQVVAALYSPSAGIVDPFGLNIAMAEIAAINGVEFRFYSEVNAISKIEQGYKVYAGDKEYLTKMVVNAAGLYADDIHNMVSNNKISIHPKRGEYMLLDDTVGNHVTSTIFKLKGKNDTGKGILVTPTVHGNLLVGPTGEDLYGDGAKCCTNTTASGLAEVKKKSAITVKNIPYSTVITSFAGLRAIGPVHDFIIEEVKDAPGFIDCAGIQSPGLTSSPAIGKYVAEIALGIVPAEKKYEWNSKRKPYIPMKFMPPELRNKLISQNPAYGRIVCRCVGVSEGEIVDAIHSPLGVRSLDGLKRRVGSGMGRCQAGFCTPKTIEIMARELERKPEEIIKNTKGSEVLTGGDN